MLAVLFSNINYDSFYALSNYFSCTFKLKLGAAPLHNLVS